jgi:hypothetical protein
MTRSPEACSASTRRCPTMPFAPAIATVRDASARGLVAIISSFHMLCVRNASSLTVCHGMWAIPIQKSRGTIPPRVALSHGKAAVPGACRCPTPPGAVPCDTAA